MSWLVYDFCHDLNAARTRCSDVTGSEIVIFCHFLLTWAFFARSLDDDDDDDDDDSFAVIIACDAWMMISFVNALTSWPWPRDEVLIDDVLSSLRPTNGDCRADLIWALRFWTVTTPSTHFEGNNNAIRSVSLPDHQWVIILMMNLSWLLFKIYAVRVVLQRTDVHWMAELELLKWPFELWEPQKDLLEMSVTPPHNTIDNARSNNWTRELWIIESLVARIAQCDRDVRCASDAKTLILHKNRNLSKGCDLGVAQLQWCNFCQLVSGLTQVQMRSGRRRVWESVSEG